jgi:tetraacyldisaccharide 4'-kinase
MPFSWLYGTITNIRNALYERGVLKSYSLGAPTVSVGNITVGGTGKTPFVAFVAEVLAERGAKVCILTRGYGRAHPRERVLVSDGEKVLVDARKAGDEPFELANKLLGKALVAADADRVAAAGWTREKFGITAFVLDDGFQHRRAKRDLDIVLIDATNPFGNSKPLPFGILREPLKNLVRAGLIVITRADLVSAGQISNLKSRISKFNPDCPVFTAENKISKITELRQFNAKMQRRKDAKTEESFEENPEHETRNPELETRKAAAFCALGNPSNFFEQLRRENFTLTATREFPDHHRYTADDITKLEKEAARSGAEILLTTAKDAVKLTHLNFETPCFVVESKLVFDDEKKLREMLGGVPEVPEFQSSRVPEFQSFKRKSNN